MRLSNKSTFSLACLVLLFALGTIPAMANTMVAEWMADVDAVEEDPQPGWMVTLTYATAPTIANAPTASNVTVTNAAVDGFAPTAGGTPAVTDTTTVFTFRVELTDTNELSDSDITLEGHRRVSLTNGRDLAPTSIYTPKLKKITAPLSAKATFEATIEFENPAAVAAGPPIVPGIGPATGLRVADISVDNSATVISVNGSGNRYTAEIVGTADGTVGVTLNSAFPHQTATVPADGTASVVRDVLRPTIGVISIATRGNDRVPAADVGWSNAFDVVIQTIVDAPEAAVGFDLKSVSYSVSPNARGADVGDVGTTSDGRRIAKITPKANTTTSTWPATTITITVTVVDYAGNESVKDIEVLLAARDGTGSTTDPDPDPDPDDTATDDTPETGDPKDITVPPKSYVLVSEMGSATGLPSSLPDNASQVTWGQIPDLEDLFYRGGTLLLTHVKSTKVDHDDDDATDERETAHRDLVITEIMWALNNAAIGQDGETARQWIEIYNNLDVPVTATISGKYGKPASSAGGDQVMLDRVSNVVGGGWSGNLSGLGQNGFDDDIAAIPATETISGAAANYGAPNVDFISMYRKERGKDGWVKGHWAQSTEIYLANHKGTPGTSERGAVGTIGATSFNVGNVIFNEISNRSNADKAYEWIELRNKGGGNVNLQNWQISIVTAVGQDNTFYTFPNANRTIGGNGHLLLVDTDPASDPNHPLATGWNITKNANSQANGVGAHSPRYMVADFQGNGLPDDGNFVLIFRNHNNKRGKAEHLQDIAGYDTTLKVSANDAGYTNLWPLSGGVPSAELSNNKLEVNKVHRRQNANIWGTHTTDGNKADKTAFRDIGWTGIGYARNAAATDANGGTPGFPNGAEKNTGGDATGALIISEIMYDTSRNLPQWIEIQNTSKQYGVNLANWRLDIVNHGLNADGSNFADSRLVGDNIGLSGKLPPNQTYLIASVGSREDTNLPAGRIHNLRRGRGNKLLNPNGFQITLKANANKAAHEHQLSDVVGNLADPSTLNSRRADAQAFADIAWELPSGVNDQGDRVSLARKTSDKIGRKDDDGNWNGTKAWNWVLSDADPRLNQMRTGTFFGHSDDISSPGHTLGAPLPVKLSHFRPTLENGQVVIRWTTESELNNAGFNILRSDSRNGEFKQVNAGMIEGQGTTGERSTYKWVDATAKPNAVYYYQIEDVSFAGEHQTLTTTKLKGLISARGKATTTWGELKEVQ